MTKKKKKKFNPFSRFAHLIFFFHADKVSPDWVPDYRDEPHSTSVALCFLHHKIFKMATYPPLPCPIIHELITTLIMHLLLPREKKHVYWIFVRLLLLMNDGVVVVGMLRAAVDHVAMTKQMEY